MAAGSVTTTRTVMGPAHRVRRLTAMSKVRRKSVANQQEKAARGARR